MSENNPKRSSRRKSKQQKEEEEQNVQITTKHNRAKSMEEKTICHSIKQIVIVSDTEEEIVPALKKVKEEQADQTMYTDEESEDKDDFEIPQRLLPSYNIREKIIIVYDAAHDENTSDFHHKGDSFSPADMIKRAVKIFLQNKSAIDPKHEYALVELNDSGAVWLKDFTSDIYNIYNSLKEIPACETEDIISLDKLFKEIYSKINFEKPLQQHVPPKCVYRMLFIYGRSFTMPQLIDDEISRAVLEYPYFTMDILMTHEIPNSTNNCIKIFKYLQTLDKKGFAYFFPIGRNTHDLHIAMAKLLSHPLQRPHQKNANYTIKSSF